MPRFWPSIEHQGRVLVSMLNLIPSIVIKAEHQVIGLPLPSIEPITFPYRADALRVMPRTKVNKQNKFIGINVWELKIFKAQ